GLFDPPAMVPFTTIAAEVIRSADHTKLAQEAAVKSIVLLKNRDNLLPLSKEIASIFVTGPTATHIQALLGNYYGLSEDLVTILEGIVGKVSTHTAVNYRQGALLDRPNANPHDWVSGRAAASEVTIACVGISQLIEGEEGEAIASQSQGDRRDIRLPQNQIDFLKTIRSRANKLVVVITAGSAIACPEVFEMADALLYVWYPGEQGGKAVADVLFGDAVPSGRLPVTFPKSVEDLPPFEDYSMIGRTYRYTTKEPLFPFGFGLSYTSFKYSDLKLSSDKLKKGSTLTAEITVTNTGKASGEDVVQLYITDVKASTRVPLSSLQGFQRVFLNAGESKTVSFTVGAAAMQMVNDRGERVIEPGDFKVMVGGAAPVRRSMELGAPAPADALFAVQ
ncbi:MAG TPA: glycoside hydrolase family 3 C-terminal domain-containing protein, partial [bacterium]